MNTISLEERKPEKTLIEIRFDSEKIYKENFSLRARIGINILRLLQVVRLEIGVK